MKLASLIEEEEMSKQKAARLALMAGSALFSLFLVTSVPAACCGAGRGMGGCGCSAWGTNRLVSSPVQNLTPEQAENVATLQKNHIKETSKIRTAIFCV